MKIKLLEVSPVSKEKEYYIFSLKYTDDKGQTKDKKIYSFDQVPYKAFKGASAGQEFTVRNQQVNGYWKWTEVTPAEEGAAVAQGGGAVQPARQSSYETADERKIKNTKITRMSCLAQAVAFADKHEDNVADVLETAVAFESWVNRE